MKKFTAVLVLIAAVFMIFGFAGCSSSTTKIEDTKWTLDSLGAKDSPQAVIEGKDVIAIFNREAATVNGNAGCNSYFAGYTLTGEDGLSVGMIGSTEMYCMDPEGIMDQEQLYLKLLGESQSYTVKNDTLTIDCGDNVLIFHMTPED